MQTFASFFLFLCVHFLYLQCTRAQVNLVNTVDSDQYRNLYRIFRVNVMNIIGRTSATTRSLNNLQDIQKLQEQVPENVPFPCPTEGFRSSERPTSVHKLRPGDIDVIGAMGDSLTAGFGLGATNLLEILSENRGLSWSIGGQGTWRQFLTLPNILKEYNPKLVGYSLGDYTSQHRNSQFNVAEGGAMSVDMPYMAKELVRRIRSDPRVNVDKDWKLVTFMIGGNDFCLDVCYQRNLTSFVETYRKNLHAVLRTLRDNLPRTLVNIVPAPNLESFISVKSYPQTCTIPHIVECPCFFGGQFRKQRKQFLSTFKSWQQVEAEVVNSPEYQNLDTFAVVHQVFTKDYRLSTSRSDFTYLSADCFHFSQKGNAFASLALWNCMLERVGEKATTWGEDTKKFSCPTKENPYIFTNVNSNP